MENSEKAKSSIERLPNQVRPKIVSVELNKILSSLRGACPEGAEISFDFDGTLHVHIDIREHEDLILTESILPRLCLGIFHDIQRGNTPHRSFFHRVSAQIEI